MFPVDHTPAPLGSTLAAPSRVVRPAACLSDSRASLCTTGTYSSDLRTGQWEVIGRQLEGIIPHTMILCHMCSPHITYQWRVSGRPLEGIVSLTIVLCHMCSPHIAYQWRVICREAREAETEKRQALLEQALYVFARALEYLHNTQEYTRIADIYGFRGQVLEELGQRDGAIAAFREGYEMFSLPNRGAVGSIQEGHILFLILPQLCAPKPS